MAEARERSIVQRIRAALGGARSSSMLTPEQVLSSSEMDALTKRFSQVPADDSMNAEQFAVHWVREQQEIGRYQPEPAGVTLTSIEDVLKELTGKTINARGTTLADLAEEFRRTHGVLLDDEQVDIERLRDKMAWLVSERRMGFVLDKPSDPGYEPHVLSTGRKGTNKVTFQRGNETLVVEYKGNLYGPIGKFIYTNNAPTGVTVKEVLIDGERLHRDFRIVTFRLDNSGRRVPVSIHEYGPIPVVQRLYDTDTPQEVSEFESILDRLVRREKVS